MWMLLEQVTQSEVEDLSEVVISWSDMVEDVPEDWKGIVSRCLDPDPNERIGSHIEGWITSGKVSVRESHQETTAIVVKLNSGDGAVRFFQGGKDLGARQTYPGAKTKAVMVFLGVGHSFWLIRNASVKYITHDSKGVEGAKG